MKAVGKNDIREAMRRLGIGTNKAARIAAINRYREEEKREASRFNPPWPYGILSFPYDFFLDNPAPPTKK